MLRGVDGAAGLVSAPATTATGVHLREASSEEVERWDELVTRFENHRVVHTRAWIQSLEACGFGRPLYLVFERDGAIVGCLPGLLVRLGPLRLFGSPLPGWQTVSMGPAFDPLLVSTAEMFTLLVPFLERRHGVHHIEVLSSVLDHEVMRMLGFRGEPTPTYRARLFPGDEERTLRGLKDSARRNIRRGVKLGLVVRFEDDERFVAEHYEQLTEVFHRGGNALPSAEDEYSSSFGTCGPPGTWWPSLSSGARTRRSLPPGCSPSKGKSCSCGCGPTAPAIAGTVRPS